VTWDRIPEWLQDNEYIRTGFRIPSYSYWKSFASWSYLHNQSVNIYSHLFGAIVLFVVGVWLYQDTILSHKYETAGGNDAVAFAFFFVAGMCCLCFSTTFHTLSNHSPEVRSRWVHLDILGIVALTIGTFVPGLYYCFYCQPALQVVYWVMVCERIGLQAVTNDFVRRSSRYLQQQPAFCISPNFANTSGEGFERQFSSASGCRHYSQSFMP
jgi:adiponectin receptor